MLYRAISSFPKSRFDPRVWDAEIKKCGLHKENPWLYDFVLNGVSEGFKLQVKPDVQLDSNTRNLPTTSVDDLKITQFLLDALDKNRVVGPFHPDRVPAELSSWRACESVGLCA